MQNAELKPVRMTGASPLKGDVSVPGDKSISHRALILGALAIKQDAHIRPASLGGRAGNGAGIAPARGKN